MSKKRKIFVGTVVIPLDNPMKYEDKTFGEVVLDFSKMSGKITIDAERELAKNGNLSIIRPMSAEYCGHIAARISGIPSRAFFKLPFDAFEAAWQTVSAYLNNRDPQEFYTEYSSDDESDDEPDGGDFTSPGIKPGTK